MFDEFITYFLSSDLPRLSSWIWILSTLIMAPVMLDRKLETETHKTVLDHCRDMEYSNRDESKILEWGLTPPLLTLRSDP